MKARLLAAGLQAAAKAISAALQMDRKARAPTRRNAAAARALMDSAAWAALGQQAAGATLTAARMA
jgi:hypothetical protein